MAFSGYPIFPGLTTIGVVNAAVQELAVTFNLEALDALQSTPEEDLGWADICGVTPAVFRGKVPLDLTALDGFEPFDGERRYKQVDVVAIQSDVNPWQRNLEWPISYDASGNLQLQQIYNATSWAQAMINAARVMKARLAASVFMQGTPSTAKALVYAGNSIPGASKSLFNTSHYANPLDANSATFSNYQAAAGTFSPTTYATTRKNMRTIPSPTSTVETLGLQVTDIIGPSHMEEPFRQVALSQLYLQAGTGGASGSVAAPTNIYAQGTTPCRFWVAPQLDGDPYVVANPGSHMWIAVSRRRPGARPIEMVAPTKDFTPRLQLLGDGTEEARKTRKIRLLGDLDAGAAAGLPHVVARYEET